MSRRAARLGSLLLAGLLLGLVGLAGPAAGQQQGQLGVALRGVEPAPGGLLRLTIAMSGPAWTGGASLEPGDMSATMDGREIEVTAARPLQGAQGTGERVSVILAVDTSGSMRENNNIARAREAAARFTAEMQPGTRVGVISFADRPRVEQALTTNREQVQQVIGRLEADPNGNTALYDAVVKASQLLAGEEGQRNLVVLSDGRHDGTPTTLPKAIAAAVKAKVITDTFGLKVPGFEQDQEALRELSQKTRGRAFEASVKDLEGLFGDAGQKLASQYVVDLALPPGVASGVDFRLTARANGEEGEYHNEQFFIGTQVTPSTVAIPAELPRAPALSRLESEQGRYVLAIAGFATVLLACL
ncbi:MAG TPA: vWA domain-containing protein, partial [Actinomycetota bacterium]|nr:vWA domain-containing protein [Actinomycetota bacterium]